MEVEGETEVGLACCLRTGLRNFRSRQDLFGEGGRGRMFFKKRTPITRATEKEIRMKRSNAKRKHCYRCYTEKYASGVWKLANFNPVQVGGLLHNAT